MFINKAMKEFPITKNMSTIYDNITAFYSIIVSLIPFDHFILQKQNNQISVFPVVFRIFLKPKAAYVFNRLLVFA